MHVVYAATKIYFSIEKCKDMQRVRILRRRRKFGCLSRLEKSFFFLVKIEAWLHGLRKNHNFVAFFLFKKLFSLVRVIWYLSTVVSYPVSIVSKLCRAVTIKKLIKAESGLSVPTRDDDVSIEMKRRHISMIHASVGIIGTPNFFAQRLFSATGNSVQQGQSG